MMASFHTQKYILPPSLTGCLDIWLGVRHKLNKAVHNEIWLSKVFFEWIQSVIIMNIEIYCFNNFFKSKDEMLF